MRKILLLLICCSFFSGCSLLNMFASTEIRISPEIVEAMNEAQSFLGKTKQEVLNRYGSPIDIRYHVLRNSQGKSDNAYDEEWSYRYDAGIPIIAPNQYAIIFYFRGDIVELVTG